jgi:hypothetical protein
MRWFFKKIYRIDRSITSYPKERQRPKLIKFKLKMGILQQILLKSRGLLGSILKMYIPKIEKSRRNGYISRHNN